MPQGIIQVVIPRQLLAYARVEFLEGPPTLFANTLALHEDSIDGFVQDLNLVLRIDAPKEAPHLWLVRLNKTKESVVTVIGTTNP